jgi:uncharacterized membrane protein
MSAEAVSPRRNVLGPVLWGVQGVLALFFIYGGYAKLATPADQLAQMMPWTAEHPTLVLVTGVVDLLGGIGILLPALLRIQPRLTVLAAIGMIILQVLAFGFHAMRGELAVTPLNVVLLALAVVVLWGRGRARPISAR